jgi:carboxyl-terminal processing protease
MNEELRKKLAVRGLSIILVIAVFIGGVFIGRYSNANNQVTAEEVATLSSNSNLNQFWSVWKLMNEKYPFKDKIPADQDRMYGAIEGMVNSFNDPYTMFFPPKEAKLFADEVKGQFSGIGMEVEEKNGLITVVSPLKDSPAEKAGIHAGDIVVKIDGKSTETMSVDEAVNLIRGKEGTSVVLTIARKGENALKDITIIRDTIALPIVDTKQAGDTFIISLYSFSENSPRLFTDAVQKFIDSKSRKLIIDLRNNPGGYLDAAVDIGSLFIPEGKIIVRENQGNNNPEIVYRSHGTDFRMPSGLKIAILVNNGSASASEIFAGAMAEHGVATLVGTQTFGKGSVQELIPLADGSSLKVTVAKWLTPNGVSISEKGIAPKYVVDTKPTDKIADPVLEKAFTLVGKK